MPRFLDRLFQKVDDSEISIFINILNEMQQYLLLDKNIELTKRKVASYDKFSAEKKLKSFYSLYSYLEHYVCEVEKNYSKKEVRELILAKFPKILEINEAKIPFIGSQAKDILIGQMFFLIICNKINKIIGIQKDTRLALIQNFLYRLPKVNENEIPFTFNLIDLKNNKNWLVFFAKFSKQFYSEIRDLLGDETTCKIFDESFQYLNEIYQGEASFSNLVVYLPDQLIDEKKISLFNSQQAKEILLNKIDELKEANKYLELKNQELTDTQNKLMESREIAIKASELKTMFLNNMSHEIKTPLTAILGFAELLEMHSEEPKSIIEYSDYIKNNGLRLLDLINNFLNISRIDSGELELKVEQFASPDLLEIENRLQWLTVKQNCRLKLHLENNVPLFLKADKSKIMQILYNVLHNAIKFSPNADVDLLIAYDKTIRNLVIRISDNGIGIDSKQLPFVFEEFFQVEMENQKIKGSGLGLSISKKLCDVLDGHIEIQSQLGKGTVVSIKIPVVPIFKNQNLSNEGS